VNTIPGEDIFYYDCRILPNYGNNDVLSVVRRQANDVKRAYKVNVDLEVVQNESSPPTSEKSPLVATMIKVLRNLRKVEPKVVGIGGGTVAAYFRRAGADAVVWGTGDESAHSTKEHVKIDNMIADSKVFAAMMLAS